MSLIKWDPFETWSEIQDDIDRLFNRKLAVSPTRKGGDTDWYPKVDIHEDKEAYHFDLEVPGMDKSMLDIKIEDNVLTIKGERKREEEKKEKNYYRVEREYGTFSRSFWLPETADPGRVNAEYKNGMLFVTIGRRETAKPKQIEIKAA